MNLLLDLGNTRLKWALADSGQWLRDGALPWAKSEFTDTLLAQWQHQPQPERILGAAVSTDDRRKQVDDLFEARGWGRVEWLRSPASMSGLINAYGVPENLGIDRFLSLLWAHATERAPCIIASCGSALTLDALHADGRHAGGLIVPGVTAMLQALHGAAPALPQADDGQILPMTRSTVDAIASGPWQAAAGAIERFARLFDAQAGVESRILLSGGDAQRMASLLSPGADIEVVDKAVLQGMMLWSLQP